MRIAFFGTAQAALPTLHAIAAVHDVGLVVTQPPRPRGRRGTPQASPVAEAAADLGLEVAAPVRLDADPLAASFALHGFDAGVVVAYGQILPDAVVHGTRLGLVNLHFSLLPRWRGAAPIERALLAGDSELGVCTMRVAPALDTGEVFLCEKWQDDGVATAGDLTALFATWGARMVLDTLGGLEAGTLPGTAQNDAVATYAPRLAAAEGVLRAGMAATDLHRAVRAFTPRPGASFTAAGRRLKVWRTRVVPEALPLDAPGTVRDDGDSIVLATGAGWLELIEVQPAGRRRMPAREWARGWRGAPPDIEA